MAPEGASPSELWGSGLLLSSSDLWTETAQGEVGFSLLYSWPAVVSHSLVSLVAGGTQSRSWVLLLSQGTLKNLPEPGSRPVEPKFPEGCVCKGQVF